MRKKSGIVMFLMGLVLIFAFVFSLCKLVDWEPKSREITKTEKFSYDPGEYELIESIITVNRYLKKVVTEEVRYLTLQKEDSIRGPDATFFCLYDFSHTGMRFTFYMEKNYSLYEGRSGIYTKQELWPEMERSLKIEDVNAEAGKEEVVFYIIPDRNFKLDFLSALYTGGVIVLLILGAYLFWIGVERLLKKKKMRKLTVLFILVLFAGLGFSQQEKSQFVTSDENFPKGTIEKVWFEDRFAYVFKIKEDGSEKPKIFASWLSKENEPYKYLTVFDPEKKYIAGVGAKKLSSSGYVIIIFYVDEEEGKSIERVGTAVLNGMTIDVYDQAQELVARIWKYVLINGYYVKLESDKIRTEAILSVIPMKMEIENQEREKGVRSNERQE